MIVDIIRPIIDFQCIVLIFLPTFQVQDAQAAMRLYTLHRREWERFYSKNSKKLKANIKLEVASSQTGKETVDDSEGK